MASQPTPPAKPQTEEQKRLVAHTRSGPSAFGVMPHKPAAPDGDRGWTPIGRDSPAAKAALAEREAAKYAPKGKSKR
jgi:hypothetical protein